MSGLTRIASLFKGGKSKKNYKNKSQKKGGKKSYKKKSTMKRMRGGNSNVHPK